MQLEGKRVFITGGTGGIGVPLVKLLRAEGTIVTAYDHEKQGDITENLASICKSLAENSPDILINMAGYNEFAYCESQNARSMIALNLLAPICLAQAVIPEMKKRAKGQIINIGSMTGLIPLPHMSVYAASKAGLKGFSDSLRRELTGSGIFVTHISPRAVKTNANSSLVIELNRQTGVKHDEPEDVAQRILTAILRNEKDVRIGWPERFFALMHSLLPSVVDKGLNNNRIIAEQLLAKTN